MSEEDPVAMAIWGMHEFYLHTLFRPWEFPISSTVVPETANWCHPATKWSSRHTAAHGTATVTTWPQYGSKFRDSMELHLFYWAWEILLLVFDI